MHVCIVINWFSFSSFSACIIFQENSKAIWPTLGKCIRRRSFICHLLFLLILSFFLLSRLPKISVWYSTNDFLCKRISQSVLIYLMTLYTISWAWCFILIELKFAAPWQAIGWYTLGMSEVVDHICILLLDSCLILLLGLFTIWVCCCVQLNAI